MLPERMDQVRQHEEKEPDGEQKRQSGIGEAHKHLPAKVDADAGERDEPTQHLAHLAGLAPDLDDPLQMFRKPRRP